MRQQLPRSSVTLLIDRCGCGWGSGSGRGSSLTAVREFRRRQPAAFAAERKAWHEAGEIAAHAGV